MNLPEQYNEKIKLTARGAWMATLLAALPGYGILKKIIIFVLGSLYEFFIQPNPLKH